MVIRVECFVEINDFMGWNIVCCTLVCWNELCNVNVEIIRLKLFLSSMFLNSFWSFVRFLNVFLFFLCDVVKGFFILRLLKNVWCFLILVGGS